MNASYLGWDAGSLGPRANRYQGLNQPRPGSGNAGFRIPESFVRRESSDLETPEGIQEAGMAGSPEAPHLDGEGVQINTHCGLIVIRLCAPPLVGFCSPQAVVREAVRE